MTDYQNKPDLIGARLTQYAESLGISVAKFEADAGLANGFVSNTNAKMRKGSLDKLRKTYPKLNIQWVFSGEGKPTLEVLPAGPAISAHPAISDIGVPVIKIPGHENHPQGQKTRDPYNDLLEIVRGFQETSKTYQNQINHLLDLLDVKMADMKAELEKKKGK